MSRWAGFNPALPPGLGACGSLVFWPDLRALALVLGPLTEGPNEGDHKVGEEEPQQWRDDQPV